jgi:signal transduction histidine kinase
MRLSNFILENLDAILRAWDDFARSLPPGDRLTAAAIRNEAEEMLRFIARDIESSQSLREQFLKSIGAPRQPMSDDASPAHDHGLARAVDRFTLPELVSEFRALRASVLSLWVARVGASKDMNELIRFDEAVDQLIAESVARYAGQLDHDADVFTASIGHDLRNPLNAISMSAQVLDLCTKLDEDERSAVQQIAHSAMRMGAMLGELQDFSRVRLAPVLNVQRSSIDVASLCADVVEEIKASQPDCRITFSRSGDTTAMASGERILQMLSNLVGNAVQHGDGRPIDVAVVGHDKSIEVTVHNDGRAIPPEALPRIFEPLYRVDDSMRESRDHLGLGLYIARTIAAAHGGDIQAVSTEDDGTTFLVRLPREPASV